MPDNESANNQHIETISARAQRIGEDSLAFSEPAAKKIIDETCILRETTCGRHPAVEGSVLFCRKIISLS